MKVMNDAGEINKNLQILNKQLAKLNSFGYQFFISVAKGVGTVLGATIVFSIVIAILASFLKTTGLYPAIESLLSAYKGNY